MEISRVSSNMWTEPEWYDWLEANGGPSMVSQYHPEATAESADLEEFFS